MLGFSPLSCKPPKFTRSFDAVDARELRVGLGVPGELFKRRPFGTAKA